MLQSRSRKIFNFSNVFNKKAVQFEPEIVQNVTVCTYTHTNTFNDKPKWPAGGDSREGNGWLVTNVRTWWSTNLEVFGQRSLARNWDETVDPFSVMLCASFPQPSITTFLAVQESLWYSTQRWWPPICIWCNEVCSDAALLSHFWWFIIKCFLLWVHLFLKIVKMSIHP